MKSCVTACLVLVSGFYPSALTAVAPLLISAVFSLLLAEVAFCVSWKMI